MNNIPVFEWKKTVSVNGSTATDVDFPELEQKKPFDAKGLFSYFCENFEDALLACRDKRFEATGVATKIGPDIHGKPSMEISDCVGGQCFMLFVFASEESYKDVAVGDTVTCRGNYLGVTNEFGVVMKRSEVLKWGNPMKTVCEFLQKAHVFYVATVEGDQPRVRPFGIAHIIDGKLCVMTGKCKPVSYQLAANPKAEICACAGVEWVRIAGKLLEDDKEETRQAMLDAYPSMKKTYAADDGNMQVLYFADATATFDSFKGEHRVVKF